MKGLADPEGETLYEINENTTIQAEISDFNGVRYLSVRKWVYSERAGGWIRTSKGLSLPTKEWAKTYDALGEFIDKRRQASKRR